MAKGDKKKHQAAIDTQQNIFQPGMNTLQNTLYGTQGKMAGNYDTGVGKNMGSYDEIMGGYRDIFDDPTKGGRWGKNPGGNFTPGTYTPQTYDYTDPFNSYGGFTEFSKTGGLSDAAQADLRARGIAPTRAIYQNAIRGINRQKALQGGYSPNATAALAKNKREMSQQIADANINTNAGIAEMVQKGRLAGLGGMYGIEGNRLNAEIDKNKFAATQKNWAEEQTGQDRRYGAGLAASSYRDPGDQRLEALRGMSDLYGATPGMAQLFGDQVARNQGQLMDAQRMQGDWGQNQINQQYQNSQIPGGFQSFMNNLGTGLGMAGSIGAGLTGIGGIWGGANKLMNRGKGYQAPGGYQNTGQQPNYSRMYQL